MTKAELMDLVGKPVRISFKDGSADNIGILKYIDEFSEKYDFRKPGYFYIDGYCLSFKVSHTKKVEVLNDYTEDLEEEIER